MTVGVIDSMVALLPDPDETDPGQVQAWVNAFAAVLELVYGVDVVPVTVRARKSLVEAPVASNGSTPPAAPAASAGPPRRRRSWSEDQKREGAHRGHDVGPAKAAREFGVVVSLMRTWMAKYPASRPAPAPTRRSSAHAEPEEPTVAHQFPATGPIERRPIDQDAARARAGQSL